MDIEELLNKLFSTDSIKKEKNDYMNIFKLPIELIDNKKILDENILNDLELINYKYLEDISDSDTNNLDIYEGSVQRGDAEMDNKVTRVIRHCINLKDNPIKSIHDQGAGGLSNAVKEIIEPYGANICLDNIILGDNTMSALEI